LPTDHCARSLSIAYARVRALLRVAVAAAFVSLPRGGEATTLAGGHATITFDVGVWAAFGLTPNAWIGSAGNPLPVGPDTGPDLLDTAGEPFANPQIYPVNPVGVDVTPDPRRSAPPTSFTYAATDVATLHATASGNIALAGVSRWTVAPDLGGGQLLFGDYALAWNAASGRWELSNYIDFPVVTFWIGNPDETTGPGDDFSVSGDLIGSPFLNILLSGALGQDFGDFEFATVPEPSAAACPVAVLALAGIAAMRRRSACVASPHMRRSRGQTRRVELPHPRHRAA